MKFDNYGRTPEERKIWLKESQKYWERQINRLLDKTGTLQKQLRFLEEDYKQAEVILRGINTELGE